MRRADVLNCQLEIVNATRGISIMTRTRYILAFLLSASLAGEAPAQFFPPPIFFLPTVSQPGIGFTYGSNHLNIAGFFASSPPSLALIPWRPTPFGPVQVGP